MPTTHTKPSPATGNDPLDIRAIYHLVLEKLWLIALCFLVAGLATTAHLLRSPRIYAARSVLQVEQEEAKILNIQRIQQEELQSLESLKTVEQTLQNPGLFGRVIDANHLSTDPRLISPDTGTPSQERLIEKMSRMIEVRLRKGTRLIDIKVEHTDPALTAIIANSLVREFLRQNYEHNADSSEVATEFLEKESRELKRKLELSETGLQSFKEQMQVSSLEDRQNVVLEKLKELGTRVTEAKSQRIVQETAYKQALALTNESAALLVIPAVASDAAVVEIRSNIARQESDLANLGQRYKEKHPKFLQAQSQLKEWKTSLERAIMAVPQRLRAATESARAAEQALEEALREQEITALQLNKQAVRYNVLAREVESDRALYQSIINRIKETSVTKDLKPSKVRVIQQASVPEKPIKPEKIRVILAGLVGALVLSVLLLFLLNALDCSLHTVDQTEAFLGVPVLSAIPRFPGTRAEQLNLITANQPQSGEAESFRTLRTALSMLGRADDLRVSLFTSALPSEGKTFCSLNYALSLAHQGLRTLIIDCDLRRPMVEKLLLNNNQRNFGLTDLLTAQKTFAQAVRPAGPQNLYFMPSGTQTPNPSELLAHVGISAVLEEALRHFDRVVVDSAPIHAVSDTLLIVDAIQTVCLVVRAGKTPRNSVRRALDMLRHAEAPIGGVILNLLPRSRQGGYYYYDSYYDYGYHGKYAESTQA
jgi:capsular exopolysaccharide synthesis family protein